MLGVVLRSDTIDLVARNTGRARPGFKVQNERSSADEHLVTFLARALHSRIDVQLGTKVVLQIAVVLEETAT